MDGNGGDIIYPGVCQEKNGNKSFEKTKKEKMVGEYKGDILNPSEESGE